MLCDACKKREAVVHIVKIENGRRTDLHLCAACAKKQTNFSNFRDLNIIDNDFFRKMAYPDYQGRSGDEPRCASCGMTYSEFNRLGKFGCPDCYEAFKEEIPPLLRRIHGHSKHVGKVPTAAPASSGRRRTSSACASTCRSWSRKNAMKKRPRSAMIRALQRQLPDGGKGGRSHGT